MGTVQINPSAVLAPAALVGGGLGRVREARADLSAATTPQRERFSSIRT
jgi:hypothetical protein